MYVITVTLLLRTVYCNSSNLSDKKKLYPLPGVESRINTQGDRSNYVGVHIQAVIT
jgi:hypothetical protein